jgi:transposase-like protein
MTKNNFDLKNEYNLLHIKYMVMESKEVQDKPFIFSNIKSHLGKSETYQTLTYERWKNEVKCIRCKSTNIDEIAPKDNLKRYLCNDCDEEFSDVSETPIDDRLSSITIWVDCWYLIGIGTSISKISEILKIDVKTIKYMILELKKIFGDEMPLAKLEEKEKLKDIISIIKKNVKQITQKHKNETELGYSAEQEVDTAEMRRQNQRKNQNTK